MINTKFKSSVAVYDIRKETTSDINVALRGLRPFTNYSIQVAGFTSVGDGVMSEPIICTTDEDGIVKHLIF